MGLSLALVQKGVSVSGGAVAFGYVAQAALATDAALLAVHQANALNSVTRSAVFVAVQSILQSFHH